MKKLYALALLLLFSFTSEAQSQSVVICTGEYAYAYHSYSTCPGLNNCRGELIVVKEIDAQLLHERKPCCKCYPYASTCTDDAPQYSGGGGDAAGYVAAGAVVLIIAGSAIVLSNDVYGYPIYSFKNAEASYSHPAFRNGTGWSFGFRKTFDFSALEYGVNYIKYSFRPDGSPFIRHEKDWGVRLSFVHDIFFSKTPDNIRFYIGPTVNYFVRFGYGGIAGVSVRLVDRLKLDTRYELTTQSHQFQIGLIFTYQKKYFWKR